MTISVIPFSKCENWYKFILYQFFLNNVFSKKRPQYIVVEVVLPAGIEPTTAP